jgi:2-hydroxychromene-2-carboxylate isomerase
MTEPIALDFYFDVSCRWAWWTSVWLRRLAEPPSLSITWRVFSLAVQDNPDDYRQARQHHARDFDLHRALVAARHADGNAGVERLYRAYGNAIHADKLDVRDRSVQSGCLNAAGLPTTLFDEAQRDATTEDEVIDETRAAMAFGVLGTPSLSLSGSDVAVLGPILGQVPEGPEALDLWQSVRFALEHPYLYELKRNRDKGTPEGIRAD